MSVSSVTRGARLADAFFDAAAATPVLRESVVSNDAFSGTASGPVLAAFGQPTARFAASADQARGVLDPVSGPYDHQRYPRPNRAQYPYWFGEVRRTSRNGNEGYRFEGRAPQVDGLNDLVTHKHALDFARRDLMNTSPAYKRGEGYRDAAVDVLLAHHYLIARVYEWGSTHPNDDSLNGQLYQNLVRDLWLESLSMMVEYEQYNDNDGWLRENLFKHLYRTLKETRLDDRYVFYRNLVEDIRRAID